MTPPPTTLVSRLRALPAARPPPAVNDTPLCPAVPAAVIVPPAVAYLLSIALVTGVHALLTNAPSGWTLLRAGTLAALLYPILYCVRVIHRTRGGKAGAFLLPASATVVALLLDWILPGWHLHPITMATLVACGLLLHPFALAWRDWWIRHRPMRATLLAPDEWAATAAILGLEEIPGLTIVNAIIPECDEETATKLLRRPVRGSLDGPLGPRLEKHVIVHCPTRDRRVGSWIAQLVARGHVITSKSKTKRNAEGRVDTTKADPLSLLLARPSNRLANAASRLMDFGLSLFALVLLAPVFAAVAIAIRLEGSGPLLYIQERMGARGRRFRMYKFRSMRPDAEAASGPVWASEQDPRITRVGAFLRKYRLDELPQFVNVLLGDMALVGPRPERPHFCETLRDDVPLFDLRAVVRPGITGWAQVRAPYAAASEEARVKLGFDLFYVSRRSPWFDLAILFETLGVALSGQGAR